MLLASGSGAAGLIYQVVWMRRLVLVYGSTTLATSTVLVTFLGGLAIGAWCWGKVADRHPGWGVGLFGVVEAGIGVYGLASGWVMAGVEALYVWLYPVVAVEGGPGVLVGAQLLLSGLMIIPAAVLMGGTVPLLARGVVRGGEEGAGAKVVEGVGVLYGWNTVGAAIGAALATYGLLPGVGLGGAVRLAAVGNLVVGAGALLVDAWGRRGRGAGRPELRRAAGADEGGLEPSPVAAYVVLQGMGLSGFAAMGYEVVWARLLALVMGSSVYAFGTLVVVVLVGLGIGSALYGRLRVAGGGHLVAFGVLELLIAVSASLSLIVVPALPEIVVRLHPLVRDAFALQAAEHVTIAASIAFLPALLLGATFPAVVGSLGGTLGRVGRTIGRAYGANTVGTVVGAYLAGFVLIPAVGLRATIVLGVVANLVAGLSVLLVARTARAVGRAAAVLAAAAVALALVVSPGWRREALVAGGALAAPHQGSVARLRAETAARRLLFYQDGVSATLSVEQAGGYRVFRVNGRTNASTLPADMLVQVLPAHLPMLWHPNPRRVFIVGLGSGITTGAIARYPVEHIDVAELEPAGPRAARFFEAENHSVLSDRRVRVLGTDARARLLAIQDRYDVIISIPSHLWVAGTAILYTREFYETARTRLAPGGIFVQWVQKAGLAPQSFRLVATTFQRSFRHTTVWSAGPTHALLLGSQAPQRWDLSRLRDRIAQTPGVSEDLRAVGIWHPLALFGAFVLGEDDVGRLVAGVGRVQTDDWPVIEFAAPRSVFDDTAPVISAGLDGMRRTPLPPIDGFDAPRDLDARATYLLGFAYAWLSRSSLAITTMEAAVRAAPAVAAYRVGLANQYLRAGRRRDALTSYQAAVANDPRQSEALLALGTMHNEDGDADAALEYYRRAVDAAPNLAEPRMALAGALLDRGQASTAVPHLERALAQSPGDTAVIERLGRALIASGRAQAALTHLAPAVTKHPNDAPLHRALGDAWQAAGRPDLAVEAFFRAATLAPDAPTLAALGRALLRAGRAREAVEAARRALALDPFSPAALDLLDQAHALQRSP